MKLMPKQSLLNYRLLVAIRILIATIGSYLLAATSNVFFALYLPLTRSEAVVVANMLSLIIITISICSSFAIRNTWLAVITILLPASILYLFINYA